MIKAMRFNAHSLFICGLFGYHAILGLFSACNGFIDHFRVTPGKCLESACRATILGDLLLVCGLYDGIGAAGARVY